MSRQFKENLKNETPQQRPKASKVSFPHGFSAITNTGPASNPCISSPMSPSSSHQAGPGKKRRRGVREPPLLQYRSQCAQRRRVRHGLCYRLHALSRRHKHVLFRFAQYNTGILQFI